MKGQNNNFILPGTGPGMGMMNKNPYMANSIIDPLMTSKSNIPIVEEMTKTQTYELQKEEELRIEIGKSEFVKITIESGFTEIEGAELPLNFPMEYTYKKFSIFCWTEARIK